MKWAKGGYCLPKEILRDNLPRLAANYTYLLIDSPAGLEHLNRRIISQIEGLFVILDPSLKSFKNVERVLRLTKSIEIEFNHLYLIANHRFPDETERYLSNIEGRYLGKMEYDPEVERYNLKGKSLLELPEDTPAYQSLKGILRKAGYE